MKYLLLVAGCSLLGAFQDAPPPKELTAQEIFDRMVEKITTAKTVQCTFGMTGTEKKGRELTAEGIFKSKGNSKFHCSMTRHSDDMEGTTTLSSDGKTMTIAAVNSNRPEPYKMTANAIDGVAEFFRTAFVHGGPLIGFSSSSTATDALEKGREPSPLKPGDFEDVRREKQDDRDVVRLQYTLTFEPRPGLEVTAQFVLWIDAESLLPLKRAVRNEETGLDLEETYSDWKLDEEIDDAEFKIE